MNCSINNDRTFDMQTRQILQIISNKTKRKINFSLHHILNNTIISFFINSKEIANKPISPSVEKPGERAFTLDHR